jgi:hypothetical protein
MDMVGVGQQLCRGRADRQAGGAVADVEDEMPEAPPVGDEGRAGGVPS